MTNDGIIRLPSGQFCANVRIQDGVENCGVFGTEVEARKAWSEGHKHYNHNLYDPSKATLFEWIHQASGEWQDATLTTTSTTPVKMRTPSSGTSLAVWYECRPPIENTLWHSAQHTVVDFLRRELPEAWRAPPEVETDDTMLVIATHRVRAVVDLPVVQVHLPATGVLARVTTDLHVWAVAVSASAPLQLNTAGLFDPERRVALWHTALPRDWEFDAYAHNQREFACVVPSRYALYTLFHQIARPVTRAKG